MKKYVLKRDENSLPERLTRYKSELNDEQFAVVTAQPKATLVVAGAGTGKTRAITYRVAYLIEQGVSPQRILLATFTNRASREMLRRVESLTGNQNVHRIWGGTFHRIANMMLRRHAISIGFDMKPDGDQPFAFPALTVFPERPDQSMAYLTVFPVQGGMRANLFVYWGMEDTRLRELRHQPREALLELIPGLTQFTGPFTIDGQVSIRPVDLVRVNAPERPGIVLVGDAYSTSCPAAGTGANKVLTDVQRLCSTYVPAWLGKETIEAADVADLLGLSWYVGNTAGCLKPLGLRVGPCRVRCVDRCGAWRACCWLPRCWPWWCAAAR